MLQGSIVQQLQAAHQNSNRPVRFGVYYKNTLVSLCHALEDCILASTTSPILITAFQQGKWYLQEAERYRDLAAKSRQVVIMAAPHSGWQEHPTSQLPNVDLVSLDKTDPVAEEWHLIILSPTYTAMVLCQELSEADYGIAGIPKEDRDRKFYGLWTFEPALVKETIELAISHIGNYNPELEQKLTQQLENLTQESIGQKDDLSEVVARVIDYLQEGQHQLETPNYSNQTALDRNLISNEIQAFLRMAQIMDLADATNPMAATEVTAITETLGQLLDLPAWQMKRLRLAALLHRLDSAQRIDNIISENTNRYQEDGPCCPLVAGAQVLRRMPQLQAVAQIITHQTENWNGTGKPAGLSGEEIPLESRIIGLAAEFQQKIAKYRNTGNPENSANYALQALAECQAQKGEKWEPKLIDTLALLVMGMQQGLTLPITQTKITAGMWLLDYPIDRETKTNKTPIQQP
ncbi:MAG TPA: DICT sensory domain-containing protein [Halomicronema sp.]